ncbi:fimbrial protein [Vibrio sp. V12_P9A6T4]|uniref:fimbrial protein n=1 Tax=unclassified Vibrio TaxID=2614977 RepID=UPI000B8ED5FC|nr:fimbrial protein [Vibrio sp. V12_P9A6T4]OXX55557.1 fimbrial protein [Vibrio sp. V12_P9A6T4]OXX72450.1 fimbrial protein [Vibrio sp. V03_P4A6T147]
MKKTIIASAMMVLLSASVFAEEGEGGGVTPPPASTITADQGHGVINFVGAIIDAPCSIAPESVDQSIQMGMISNVLLEKQGETPIRPIHIHLESCSTETAKQASLKFTGITDDASKKNLAILGSAKGAAISLINLQDGSEIELGTNTKGIELLEGDNVLNFAAKLVSTLKAGEKATPGQFTATANFAMSYE